MEGVSVSGIIFMLLGVYFLFTGIASIATRKVYGFGNSLKEYTEESIRANAPILGLGNVVLGITWIVSHLGDVVASLAAIKAYSWWILIGGVVVAAVIMYIGTSKMVKKEKK